MTSEQDGKVRGAQLCKISKAGAASVRMVLAKMRQPPQSHTVISRDDPSVPTNTRPKLSAGAGCQEKQNLPVNGKVFLLDCFYRTRPSLTLPPGDHEPSLNISARRASLSWTTLLIRDMSKAMAIAPVTSSHPNE